MKSIVRQSLWTFLLALFLTSCGGGGGREATDSDSNSGITYTGLTTQAQLSAANAKVMFSLLWDGEGSLGAISSSADAAKVVPAGRSNLDGLVLLVESLLT